MQGPDVRSTLRDDANNMTYHVIAYRALSREELIRCVGQYHAQPSVRRRKTPLRNKVIEIHTIIGASPNLNLV
jgi:hypothetical protein